MKIEIWHGLPYNRWEVLGMKGGLKLPTNPFQNFKLTKGDFFLQVITQQNGEVNIRIKFPFVDFTV